MKIQPSLKRHISLQNNLFSISASILILLSINISLWGISSDSTPLFDPSISGKQLGLARAATGEKNFNNINQNPASIINSYGVSLHGTQFQGIDYSAITFSNEYHDVAFGINYTGSSISSITRSFVDDDNKVTEIDTNVPYEYNSLNISIGKKVSIINLGFGINYKSMIIDDEVIQNYYASSGIIIDILKQLRLSASIVQSPTSIQNTNALLLENRIIYTSLCYKVSNNTSLFLGTIENHNELDYRSTFHGSIEHYINDIVAVRGGIDHNRIAFGTGVYLDPFDIDIGWAQSLDEFMEDQIILSFSYSFNERHRLWEPIN